MVKLTNASWVCPIVLAETNDLDINFQKRILFFEPIIEVKEAHNDLLGKYICLAYK